MPADLWQEMLWFVAHESIHEFASGFALRMRLIEYFKEEIDIKAHAKKILDEYSAHHQKMREIKRDRETNYQIFGSPYL